LSFVVQRGVQRVRTTTAYGPSAIDAVAGRPSRAVLATVTAVGVALPKSAPYLVASLSTRAVQVPAAGTPTS